MANPSFADSLATAVDLEVRRRALRCPSCCARIELDELAPGEWRVRHRCGNYVLEAATRETGAPSVWRWRALAS